MEKRIIEQYKLNQITIELVSTLHGYDVIYRSSINSKHLLKDVSLTVAYSYIAGYFYGMVRIFESGV